MAFFPSKLPRTAGTRTLTRRSLIKGGLLAAGGLAVYSTAIARHWVELIERPIQLKGLPEAFEGMRIVQLSDIHLDEFSEPVFIRHVVHRINALEPDMVLLTGDYVSEGILSTRKFAIGAAWHCANILKELTCAQVYAVLGNHDVGVSAREVSTALRDNGIPVLVNTCLPIERGNARFWLAGLQDPVVGIPDPDRAIPTKIRGLANEPVVLMCHAPDYVDTLLRHPASRSVGLMLSGHTHGGQVRFPLVGALELPVMGKRYVHGLFPLGGLQLYVNRGIGTIGLPFRLNCPPEITVITLHSA